MNKPAFKNASVLVARNNFGCGSSREHAVWAIHQAGFQVVVAPWVDRGGQRMAGFADIFRNNCSKNALWTVELAEAEVEEIFQMAERFPGLQATADIVEQRLVLHLPKEIAFHFDIDPSIQERLVHGLDDIGLSLKHAGEIGEFEKKHDVQWTSRS